MTLLNPAGLWFLLAWIPVLALYILRPRRPDVVVSSDLLWNQIDATATAAAPWQRLRPTVLLFIQLLLVALAAAALANPARVSSSPLSAHTVVVLDASASMGALDGSPDRLSDAKTEAIALWDGLPENAVASLVVAGPSPWVSVPGTADRGTYEAAVRAVQVSDGPADLTSAMALADGLETPNEAISIVLISDGQHDDRAVQAFPNGVTHRMVGSNDTNRAITELVARKNGDGLTITATLTSTGGPTVTVPLRIDVDGRTASVSDVEIPADSSITTSVDVLAGDQVIARLGGDDLLAIDNTGYALSAGRREIAVAFVGEPDPFIDAAVTASSGTRLVDPDEERPDLWIVNGVDVPDDVTGPVLAFAPPSGIDGVTVIGEVDGAIPTLVRSTDRALVGLNVSDVSVASAQRIEAPSAEILVGAEDAPLVLRGTRNDIGYAYFAFRPTDSVWSLDPSFPVLIDRLLVELGSAATLPARVTVGDYLTAGPTTDEIVDPVGTVRPRLTSGGSVLLDRPGFWSATSSIDGIPDHTVAAVMPRSESELTPLPLAPSNPRTGSVDGGGTRYRSLRWIPLVAAIAVAALEWFVSSRRVGVPPRQWRLANGLRLAGLAAVIVALIGLQLPLPADDVAVAFVLDRSDSLGSGGTMRSDDLVNAAINRADENTRVGSIVTADGARIERLVSDTDRASGVTVELDGDRTDLAAGLRLASAALPPDAKRRIILISDGRETAGDAVAEARRLNESGIPVDFMLIDSATEVDASVVAIRAPESVAQETVVPVEATISSTEDQSAVVTLRRNGEVVDSVEVELQAGSTTVTLRDTPDTSGLLSYEVSVDTAADQIPQNDAMRTSTDVDGPQRVLVVEGRSDSATTIVAALEASGIDVEETTVSDIPPLNELGSYASTVLVDVNAADLSVETQRNLVQATRDLGRGLVTIGGPQSYGMGGYRDSELEAVLPVISDVLDPERRQSVAEVLALDTSGSMGACHCAEGQLAKSRPNGGIVKTEIARAGAARAIEALSVDDEIGVLAVDTTNRWVIDLQRVPSAEVIDTGLSQIAPEGNTDLSKTLVTAAEGLEQSDAALKHIVLFSDGFTSQASLEKMRNQAAELLSLGITVSVVATGEGAAEELSPIAEAGGGRFYPGRDLAEIPRILMEESIIASRSFINEGEFLPTITGRSPVLDAVASAPQLYGFIATTAKPQAQTLMRIGDENDPLLATWQAGLGRATSWTSDSGVRWANDWAQWNGSIDFWNRLVADTFPIEGDGAVRATNDGEALRVRVEAPDVDGAIEATVGAPDGTQETVSLAEISPGIYEGVTSVDEAGTYSVGATVVTGDDRKAIGADVAELSYGAEYRPGQAQRATLEAISDASGGRGEITPELAFDDTDLDSGESSVPLAGPLVLLAALLWLAAAVLSRLWLASSNRAGDIRERLRRPTPRQRFQPKTSGERPPTPGDGSDLRTDTAAPKAEPGAVPAQHVPAPPEKEPEPSTIDALLQNKRRRS